MKTYRAARAAFWAWRARTLARSERLFSGLPQPTLAERMLFGYRYVTDVARCSANRLSFLEGERFLPERRLVLPLLRPGMRAVDIGANIGYYLLMIQHGLRGKGEIICVEPSPENIPELRRNIDGNGFRNVALHEIAIGATEGEVYFKAGINGGVADGNEAPYRLPVRPLDAICPHAIDFIKIDVEGYEGQVLDGMKQLLQRDRPILFIEMHPHLLSQHGHTVGSILGALRRLYPHIEAHTALEFGDSPRWRRLLSRYLERYALEPLALSDQLVTDCDSGRYKHTFWLICRC